MSSRMKRSTVVITLIIAIGAAAGAYAFWTAGGTGTGSATTGSNNPISAVQTSTVTGLYPGGPGQTLSGSLVNNNDGPVYVSTVTAAVSAVTKSTAVGTPAGPCTVADYAIGGTPTAINKDVPKGTTPNAWTGQTLALTNTNSNQDGCKGATVTITYTVNG